MMRRMNSSELYEHAITTTSTALTRALELASDRTRLAVVVAGGGVASAFHDLLGISEMMCSGISDATHLLTIGTLLIWFALTAESLLLLVGAWADVWALRKLELRPEAIGACLRATTFSRMAFAYGGANLLLVLVLSDLLQFPSGSKIFLGTVAFLAMIAECPIRMTAGGRRSNWSSLCEGIKEDETPSASSATQAAKRNQTSAARASRLP